MRDLTLRDQARGDREEGSHGAELPQQGEPEAEERATAGYALSVAPDPAALAGIPLFAGLTPAQLAAVSGFLHRRAYPPRTTIMTMEEPGEVAYIILSGTVKVSLEQEDGTAVILAILGPGELVGELSLIDSYARSATVVTQEEGVLLSINRLDFWHCLRTMPIISYNLARILSRRLRLANAKIQSLATDNIYGRVARQLLDFAREYGVHGLDGEVLIPMRLTQNDLAGLVGASRVRVNQALVAFKRRGLVSVEHGHQIIVHDPDLLADHCH